MHPLDPPKRAHTHCNTTRERGGGRELYVHFRVLACARLRASRKLNMSISSCLLSCSAAASRAGSLSWPASYTCTVSFTRCAIRVSSSCTWRDSSRSASPAATRFCSTAHAPRVPHAAVINFQAGQHDRSGGPPGTRTGNGGPQSPKRSNQRLEQGGSTLWSDSAARTMMALSMPLSGDHPIASTVAPSFEG